MEALKMINREYIEKLNNIEIIGLALLKIYIVMCIDLLIAALVIGLAEVVYPIIY